MEEQSYTSLELNKILSSCAEYAVLKGGRKRVLSLRPTGDLSEVKRRLNFTAEAEKLLYTYGVGKVEYFDDVSDLLLRARKGSTLSCGELLSLNSLLRSARGVYLDINSSGDDIFLLKELNKNIYYDENLEADVTEKILSEDRIADSASEALYSIRAGIRSLNERIRATLSEYASGKDSQYLQDSSVTMRGDRYVIPVKAEAKNKIKGFVHDRSASGATFFIEPEYVLNLNNELVALTLDEKQEVERILKSLSARFGAICEKMTNTAERLYEIDALYARAEYAYSLKAVCPKMNKSGYVNIIKGRHPLIEKEKVVPVSLELGKSYSFLLLSGANTGGKTVTLKMTGLFCLMAECGLFVPAAAGSELCAFGGVFCDVGDSQSIENSLSTFSGHMAAVVDICNRADKDSLVLIDELGGGTNPDEGQAIASAVCEKLLTVGAKGIITTHFTALKEFAYSLKGMENASMQFDSATLKPLYSIKIGAPGASNALAIAKRLGMSEEILTAARGYLSDEGRRYDEILMKAESARAEAEKNEKETERLKEEWSRKTEEAKRLSERLLKERENLNATARAEVRRIVNERAASAEELLGELEKLFEKQNLSEADLIKARTIKNKIRDKAFSEEETYGEVGARPATEADMKVGADVFVETLGSFGTVLSYDKQKKRAEVECGAIKLRVNISQLSISQSAKNDKKAPVKNGGVVKVVKKFSPGNPQFEINVIGKTVEEALQDVTAFLDKAVTDNLEQVKIIHGVGTGRLRTAIAALLKKHKGVKEFRPGHYGEGEIGVTIVTLK